MARRIEPVSVDNGLVLRKTEEPRRSMTWPSLSNPAAIPSGFDNVLPNTFTCSAGSSMSTNSLGVRPYLSSAIPSLCPVSASVVSRIRGHQMYSFAADLASKEYSPSATRSAIAVLGKNPALRNWPPEDDVLAIRDTTAARERLTGLRTPLFKLKETTPVRPSMRKLLHSQCRISYTEMHSPRLGQHHLLLDSRTLSHAEVGAGAGVCLSGSDGSMSKSDEGVWAELAEDGGFSSCSSFLTLAQAVLSSTTGWNRGSTVRGSLILCSGCLIVSRK
ncbi:hypothetical protein OGAPHI_001737 [Ogataea philodendri]|uniref:Uncharacterized protein n=1 Tax=Ogataea philodendri TaxID=1378263 RepID=A0A9P8T6D5_9ASCO|nr:uncharacterized protein OGAPHI_001737 [Ogataea philodendri]KAH3667983.1 hypothetical protein OGAPHI_001737 [Ogataea philodendri]